MSTLGRMERIEDIVPFGLRMRSGLRKKLEADAKEKKETVDKQWSLNKEIVDRLEKSYLPRQEIKDFSLDEIVVELKRRLGDESVAIRVEITQKQQSGPPESS